MMGRGDAPAATRKNISEEKTWSGECLDNHAPVRAGRESKQTYSMRHMLDQGAKFIAAAFHDRLIYVEPPAVELYTIDRYP